MITEVVIKNFKRLDDVSIPLSSSVVFVGPNNSGKTSALQAISLWYYGLRKWAEVKRLEKSIGKKRSGVALNRKDLHYIPTPSLKQLWKDLQVRELRKKDGMQQTRNVNILIEVAGVSLSREDKEKQFYREWKVGLEFIFANPESCYVKPLPNVEKNCLQLALTEEITYLPPMSGLTAEEYKLELGTIRVYIGQGKTADVLRNLCWYVYEQKREDWNKFIVDTIRKTFGVELLPPKYDVGTGRIDVFYKEGNTELDLINSGRGLQQVLLLLTYISVYPGTVLLIDEPDAHLEILRQREVFRLLRENVDTKNAQLIIATHSETLLNEAQETSNIIAFLGRPHKVEKVTQVLKSLRDIRFEEYLLAEQKGWVLYLEGPSDLDMLRAYARKLDHEVCLHLQTPYVVYIGNQPTKARDHFYGLKEAVKNLRGVAIFDRLSGEKLDRDGTLCEMMWNRREIENYLPLPEVLERYFEKERAVLYLPVIREIFENEVPKSALRDKSHDFWINTKISDFIEEKVLKKLRETLGIAPPLQKNKFYLLVDYANKEELDPEIKEKLDMIFDVANSPELVKSS